jgi:segregation and condensation protein B
VNDVPDSTGAPRPPADSLAAQAAAWVPPWARGTEPRQEPAGSDAGARLPDDAGSDDAAARADDAGSAGAQPADDAESVQAQRAEEAESVEARPADHAGSAGDVELADQVDPGGQSPPTIASVDDPGPAALPGPANESAPANESVPADDLGWDDGSGRDDELPAAEVIEPASDIKSAEVIEDTPPTEDAEFAEDSATSGDAATTATSADGSITGDAVTAGDAEFAGDAAPVEAAGPDEDDAIREDDETAEVGAVAAVGDSVGLAEAGVGEIGEPAAGTPGEGEPAPADAEPVRPMADLRPALEAILLVVDEPVGEQLLAQVLEQPVDAVAAELTALATEYTAHGRGFELRRAAGGWRLYTRPEYAAYVERFVLDGQSVRLTQAALETLAVVAYKQPVTRGRISAIRGVNCDGVIRTLVTRGLIQEAGTEPETGAFLYRTSSLFLEKLGLDSVAQLPPLAPFLPDNVEEIANDAQR